MKKPSERIKEIVEAQVIIGGFTEANMGMSIEAKLTTDAILKCLDEMWNNGQLVKR